MNFLYKKLSLLTIILSISLYYFGCSSTEQTTARLAYIQSEYEKCEKESLIETQQNPGNDEGWGYLAMSRIQLGKIDDARTAYEQYLKLGKYSLHEEFDNLFTNQYNQGAQNYSTASQSKDSTQQKKLYTAALKFFREAQIIYPDSVSVLKPLGYVSEKLGNNDEALKYFKKAMDSNKNDSTAAESVARLLVTQAPTYLRDKKFEECINVLKPMLSSALPKTNVMTDLVNFYIGSSYYSWGNDIRSSLPENSEDKSYQDKFKDALPYLEPLQNSSNKDIKSSAIAVLISVYGNLGMYDKSKELIEIKKQIDSENK